MSGRTFVVNIGIGQYSSASAPALPTAALDAIRVAACLQSMGAAAEDTYLFVQPPLRDVSEQKVFHDLLATLSASTHISSSCTHDVLETFWRKELRALAAANPDSRLLLYWCGHGFTEARTGLPSLLCSDWSDALSTRVLNRLDMLETLHSQDYLNLRSQLILFDACANNMTSGSVAATTVSVWENSIDQASISAAARGQYAHADDTGSYFTRALLPILQHHAPWPGLNDFSRAVQKAIEEAGQKSTPVLFRRGRGDDDVWRRSNVARDNLVTRLEQLAAHSKLRPLYLSVISALSVEVGRGAGRTIAQMVDDLWNANGSAAGTAAPYPVVEFALRVRETLSAGASLDPWIEDSKYVTPADREEARSLIKEEGESLYLVVELIESRS
ncbi:hypothetical protein BH18ACI5_BH18ACI5_27700 [soil metagenome]